MTNIHVYERYINVGKCFFRTHKDEKVSNVDLYKSNSNRSLIDNFYDTQWGAHYLVSIEMFKLKPFIGNGYRSFRNECKKYDEIKSASKNIRCCSSHPHNYVIELMAETGLVGVIIYFFFIISIFLRLKRIKRAQNKTLVIF